MYNNDLFHFVFKEILSIQGVGCEEERVKKAFSIRQLIQEKTKKKEKNDTK